MFDKLVIGVDGRDGGTDALALARTLAAPETQLVVVNAFPSDPRPARVAVVGEQVVGYEELLREDAMTALRAAAGGDEALLLHAVPDLSPARALQRTAEHEHADLLVVGSSRRGAVGRVLMGDVTRSVLHGAPCPVAVAPRDYANDPGAVEVIGVGYDGRAESRAALDLATELARARNGELRILSAIAAPVPFAPASAYTYDWSHLEEDRDRMREELAAIVEGLDVAATADVVDGLPAAELERLSAEVDLIVAGSRRWGAVKRVVLGSTTDRLAGHAACPLIVVPGLAHDTRHESSDLAQA